MPTFIPVVAVQDLEGDWYVIPKDLKDKFLYDMLDGGMFVDEFNTLYGEYKTGGDLNLTQLYIKQ